jgi:hypothetical protein
MAEVQNKEMSESEKKKEDWMNSKWRPMMGWMYMLVCTTDFILFPILWGLLQTLGGGKVESQWLPITLQGAGLFHMAMGAIIGVAAFGRTQEKLAGVNVGPSLSPVSQSVTTNYGSPSMSPNAFPPRPMPRPMMPTSMDNLPDDPPMRNTRND